MHLLFLADVVQCDCAGGAQTVAWELAKQLVGDGHSVSFLVTAAGDSQSGVTATEGIAIWRIPRGVKPWEQWRVRREMATELNRRKPVSLVHSHFAYAELGVAGVLSHLPWVRTFHGPWHLEGWVEDTFGKSAWSFKALVKRWARYAVEQWSLRRACRIMYLSEFSRTLLNGMGYLGHLLCKVPGGTDIERFVPLSSKVSSRERLKLTAGGPYLFCLRRLAPRMGLENLVHAMARVVALFPQTILLIGGRGPEQLRLKQLVSNLGLEANVQLIGFIPNEQLADYHRAADLFVLPTIALEGFGLVTVDALACGTPVLGTPIGATPEILTPLDSRLLTNGVSSMDLADGIIQFLQGSWSGSLTPVLLHGYVKEHFTWPLHAVAVTEVYKQVIECPPLI